MSGIAGLLYMDGRPAPPEALHAMLAALAHRGSDASGVWVSDSVALGHRLLGTTPEALCETQPIVNTTPGLAITADLRIDNREELLGLLRMPSRPAGPISDAALVLAAYERWGEACAERLLGDFAFALWDSGRQQLFCARDHIGIKPFYYRLKAGAFSFASEIKGILAAADAPPSVNETRILDYLSSFLEDQASTFYRDIWRLPSGHTLVASRRGVRLRRYWRLDPVRELRLGSDAEYADAFRELFRSAVTCRLRSARPVGSALSGGLDSSSVVCVARQELQRCGQPPLKTFSTIFDAVPQSDERVYIQAVLRAGDLIPHYLHGDRVGPLHEIERTLDLQDEPFLAGNLFLRRELCRTAHEHGVCVLLDGMDGDNVVSHGTGLLRELATGGHWIDLWREADASARYFNRPTWPLLWRHCLAPLSPEWARRLWRAARRRPTRADSGAGSSVDGGSRDFANIESLFGSLAPAFASKAAAAERGRALAADTRPDSANVRELHYASLFTGVHSFALEISDRAAAEFQIEPRYPFFDRRLVEFCLSLPANLKRRNGWPRYILRQALRAILPEEVRWRTGKADLGPNFSRGLLHLDRRELEAVLHASLSSLEGYVDPDRLMHLLSQHHTESAPDAAALWLSATLGLWLVRVRR